MQEHPIPQDVTSYKFHIVGNMTLKQFAEVGAGVLLAVIIYNTNLLIFIKWPLILLSVGIGGMAAFVPIEERPLDHWIMTFFRRLYSPTKFYWRKEPIVPFAMATEKQVKKTEEPPFEMDLTPARQQRIKDYLASVGQPAVLSDEEIDENSRVAAILETFDQLPVTDIQSTPMAVKPQLTTRVRKLSLSQKPPVKKETVFRADQLSDLAATDEANEPNQQTTSPVTPVVMAAAPTVSAATAPKNPLQGVEKESAVPTSTPVEIFTDDTHPPVDDAYAAPKDQVLTNTSLPFPQQDFGPNTIVGMALTQDDKLVDRAVVTIKNMQGKVIRALKTNLLGQFFATTPLPNGSYIVSVEKTGMSFPEKALTLNGSVLEPFELRAA